MDHGSSRFDLRDGEYLFERWLGGWLGAIRRV
jgi:hypothetical protein